MMVLVELLYFDGCPNAETFLPRLQQLLTDTGIQDPVQLRRIESPESAERERFLGSPSVRVNGRDIDPDARDRDDFGLKCRIYRTPDGMSGSPPEDWVLTALRQAQDTAPTDE